MFLEQRLLRNTTPARDRRPRRLTGPLALAITLGITLGLTCLTGPVAGAPAGDDLRGKALYIAHCATCHGYSGRGDGVGAQTMIRGFGKAPRNLASVAGRSDAQLSETIKWSGGQGKHGSLLPMPQWGLTLKDQDIADLVAYVRVLQKPPAITGDAANGKQLFANYCASCHGLTGQGNGPLARSSLGLKVKPRNFTTKAVMAGLTDRDIYNATKHGGPAIGKSAWMPGWGDALSDKEIGDLVMYIRSLTKK